jgi:hypothetical protein
VAPQPCRQNDWNDEPEIFSRLYAWIKHLQAQTLKPTSRDVKVWPASAPQIFFDFFSPCSV